jgi:microcystin-dependent protein
MNLPVPSVGAEPGPQYSQDVNNSLSIIDGHTHNLGSGVQITPSGLDINASLPMNNNILAGPASVQFTVQTSDPATGGSIYVKGVDLYYEDVSGNIVRITSTGTVNATSSGIASGTATASFVGGVLVVDSASNTPGNIQAGSILIGNNVAASNFVTVQAQSSLGSNYTLTLPTIPSSTLPVVLDSSGNFGTSQITLAQLSAAVSAFLMPVGTIIASGTTSTPTGYLYCDGTAASRTLYPALFTAIGTNYGAGDGSTTFNLPDCRGYFLRGQAASSVNDPDTDSRTAQHSGGNTGNNVGSVQNWQIQSHTHSNSLFDPGHGHGVGGYTSGSGVIADSFQVVSNSNITLGTFSATTGLSITNAAAGGNQTNPLNVYVAYYIKY